MESGERWRSLVSTWRMESQETPRGRYFGGERAAVELAETSVERLLNLAIIETEASYETSLDLQSNFPPPFRPHFTIVNNILLYHS